jgi:hypothetical protein
MFDRNLHWIKNGQNNEWFDFLRLNLNAPYFNDKRGAYAIWYTSSISGTSKVIRLGQGDIGDRLREHRNNPDITRYSSLGQLKVTWALVDNINFFEADLDGVEAYLSDLYQPLIGDRFPFVQQITVNPIE